MKQICNLSYALLLENRTKPQIAELEVLLAEPKRKDEMIEKQNVEAMKALTLLPGGLLVPPKKKPERPVS